MEAPHLISPDFWRSDENHIALSPARPHEASGLNDFAKEQGTRGWCFFQTSGSEGQAKWVGLEKDAFLISARAVNAHFNVTSEDRWLIAIPLHHVGGFSILARCEVSGSSAIHFSGGWDASNFVKTCVEHGITLTSLVPTQVHDLVMQRLTAPPTLRRALIGGSALSPALREEAVRLGWPLRSTYGMTEAASQIAAESDQGDLIVHPHWRLSTDSLDTLTIQGPALAKGYCVRDPSGTWSWELIDASIGLRTRDCVELTTLGSTQKLRFLGRESDSLKICGELVSRHALQSKLDAICIDLRFPGSAFIIPLPDARRETSLTLVTESGQSTSEQKATLFTAYNATAQPYERAIEIRSLQIIPKTSIGKLDLTATQSALAHGNTEK